MSRCYKTFLAMDCIALKRKIKTKQGLEADQYMIANGGNMGRWTIHFGVHCLADTFDCKEFIKLKHKEHSETKIVNYKIESCDYGKNR
jgi:hypothetical protein